MKKFLATILSVILLLTIIPMAYAEETNTYKVGDIIQFGSYPQSEVKDEALIAELNELAPVWDEWISYGYYESWKMGSWMRYTDVVFENEKYRGVKFTKYRPTQTGLSSTYNNQESNGYYVDTIYWFKFEKINWRVLDLKSGLVMSENIIDSQPFCNKIYYDYDAPSDHQCFNDVNYSNYASDYVTSFVRHWLNYDFYNWAFDENEKQNIITTKLNNNGYYTSRGVAGYEEFDSESTEDNIFLLSYLEVKNADYGFSSNSGDNDEARVVRFTNCSDYAESQGLNARLVGTKWMLRSPGFGSKSSCVVLENGASNSCQTDTNNAQIGVRPALRLFDIHEHTYTSEATTEPTHTTVGVRTFTCECGDSYTEEIAKLTGHTYNSTITPPTCTAQGYTTYTCACGDSYVAEYVNALGHKDNNGDYKCDNGCGYEFEKPAPEEPSKDCSCNCHKGGIMGFFWKIINFFNKLFKSKQYCGCGAKHW